MKRVNLYLAEEEIAALAATGVREGVSVSELARRAIRTAYMNRKTVDLAAAARTVHGLWKDRTDIPPTARYVRTIRKDRRSSSR